MAKKLNPVTYAETTPQKTKSEANSGVMIIEASTRGEQRYAIGLTDITCMASICSLTFILESSAVIADPALPVTRNEPITGASSFERAKDAAAPIRLSTPKRRKIWPNWMPKTAPTIMEAKTMIQKPVRQQTPCVETRACINPGFHHEFKNLSTENKIGAKAGHRASYLVG